MWTQGGDPVAEAEPLPENAEMWPREGRAGIRL